MKATGKIIDHTRNEISIKGFKERASGRTALQGEVDDYAESFEPKIAKCQAAFKENRVALKQQA